MLFLRGSPRPAARAVKAAVCAFIGAKRRALTEEAGGRAQSLRRKGRGFPKRSAKSGSSSGYLKRKDISHFSGNTFRRLLPGRFLRNDGFGTGVMRYAGEQPSFSRGWERFFLMGEWQNLSGFPA